MHDVKQSTALNVVFFAYDANGDGVTGKVDGDWTKRISKNGAAFGAMTVTVSELENGWYGFALSTSHTDTLGVLAVSLSASGVKRVNLLWRVEERLKAELATQASVDTLDDYVDTEVATIVSQTSAASIRSAVGLAAANLDTQLTAIDDFLDTEVAAIKAKTDNLPTDPADQSAVEAAITAAQNAVLAVLGALADAAADGDPTTTDTMVAYLKQLVNVLVGAAGVVTYPAAAAPGNAVSLAEVLRQVYDEVAGLNGGALLDAAGVRAAVGLAAANLDSQLTAIDDFLDTEVATLVSQTSAASIRAALGLAAANLDTQLDALPTAAEVTTAVWAAGTRTLTAVASGVLSAAALNELADAILDRNLATGTDSGSATVRTVRQALRVLRNKVAVSGSTLTVYKEDDATASWTAAVTQTAGDPISALDPAGP